MVLAAVLRGLGLAMLAALWIGGDPGRGLLTRVSWSRSVALILFGGRSETIRGLRGDGATSGSVSSTWSRRALAGLAVITAIIVAFLVEVSRGKTAARTRGSARSAAWPISSRSRCCGYGDRCADGLRRRSVGSQWVAARLSSCLRILENRDPDTRSRFGRSRSAFLVQLSSSRPQTRATRTANLMARQGALHSHPRLAILHAACAERATSNAYKGMHEARSPDLGCRCRDRRHRPDRSGRGLLGRASKLIAVVDPPAMRQGRATIT